MNPLGYIFNCFNQNFYSRRGVVRFLNTVGTPWTKITIVSAKFPQQISHSTCTFGSICCCLAYNVQKGVPCLGWKGKGRFPWNVRSGFGWYIRSLLKDFTATALMLAAAHANGGRWFNSHGRVLRCLNSLWCQPSESCAIAAKSSGRSQTVSQVLSGQQL